MFSIADVVLSHRIDVFLGKAKVNDMYEAVLFTGRPTCEKIFWFHVAIDNVLGMNILQSIYLK